MRLLKAVPSLFMIAAALAVMLGTADLSVWDGFTPGARFFPLVVGTVGLILSALLLWQQSRGADRGELDLPDRPGFVRVVLTVVALVGLAAGAPLIGLVPMLVLFCGFLLIVVLHQRPMPSIATALGIALGTHLVFARWLSVPLPAPFGI
jgi:hypothetical protein